MNTSLSRHPRQTDSVYESLTNLCGSFPPPRFATFCEFTHFFSSQLSIRILVNFPKCLSPLLPRYRATFIGIDFPKNGSTFGAIKALPPLFFANFPITIHINIVKRTQPFFITDFSVHIFVKFAKQVFPSSGFGHVYISGSKKSKPTLFN